MNKPIAKILFSSAFAALAGFSASAIAGAPTVSISQVPMTIAIPAHPQIMLALANSQSMDGTLSGAIMTGSGALSSSYSALNASSSPTYFTYVVGAGFTPPANLGTVICSPTPCPAVTSSTPAGTPAFAPYTVTSGSTLLDNSPSRLNVAKAGIAQILSSYISAADFGLMQYTTSGNNEYTTWVYQMSQPGGFTFTFAPGSNEYITNPCFGVNIVAPLINQVQIDCHNLSGFYPLQFITTKPYIVVGSSSDDPSINDVLYAPAGYADPICVVYGGPTPSSPFTGYTLSQYENGNVLEGYSSQVNACATQTGPTNAGYVPFSTQVMYEERGFGFYTSGEQVSANSNPLVAMTSSGATPTTTSVATAISAFTNYLQPETNSTGTPEIKAAATQSPIASLIASASAYFSSHNPASTNGCTPHRYVVLLTDGLPTMDMSGHSWPPLGSTAANATPNGYGATLNFGTSFNTDGSLNTTNDQALTDVMNQLTAANTAGTKTYIIGLGAGVNTAANPVAAQTLTAMAIAGGTANYFPAISPQDVSDDLNVIITTILAATQSTASAAVNSTGLNTNSVVYQSQFDTSDSYQDWTGNLFAYAVSSTGSVIMTPPLWSAQTQLDGQYAVNRLIATWDPVAGAATPFEWNSGTPTTGIASSTAIGQQLTTFTADTNGADVLSYLRGSPVKEQHNSGPFRNRAHKLGDIVDSSPLYIGAPSASNPTTSYLTFANSYATRPPVVYVGSNDGMLHAFDAATGNERFAYIPKGGYSNLIKLVSPYYNSVHQFYVNGSPQASDVQFADLSWHTLLVGVEGQGGNSVFGIDVTNPAAIISETALSNAVLWDVSDSDMGLGFSTPAIAPTAAGWMVFVGNGYNSPNQKPVLYALNPQTGAIMRKMDLCNVLAVNVCNMGASNGLSSVIALNTSGQINQNANIVYAGDLQGDLWRIDVSNSNPAYWTATVLFQAKDSVYGNPQPITTAPQASLNPNYPQVLGTMVFFATGQLLGNPDLTTTQVQTVYGVFDPLTGFTPPLSRGTVATLPAGTYTSSTGFVKQTLSIPSSNGTVVVATSNPVNIPTNKGWFADLTQETGQRVVTDPRLESGGALVFTSYQPQFNTVTCTQNGASYLYVLNYATGGSFPVPQFDITSDGQINSNDLVQVPNPASPGNTMMVAPVGLALGNVFAAAPTIRTADFNTASAVKLITESSGAIKSIVEKGSSKSRTAWWEIRQ